MKVLIIGAGAVGVAMAASLGGMDTAVIARGRTAEALREGGAVRTGIFGEVSVKNVAVYTDYDIDGGGFDYIIVSAKATANEEIAAELDGHRRLMGTDCKIVIFQNGWGNNEAYLKYFDRSVLYNARIITGFEKDKPNVSRVTVHTQPILLGSLYGFDGACMKPLADAVAASGIPSETTEEMEKALWAKMLFNTTLNPLGAILGLSYGAMSEIVWARRIMDGLIEETYEVMDACGYRSFWENAEEYKRIFYGKLVKDTYEHRSSTLQDIEKGLPTEIDTLNGSVIRLAAEHGISVKTHLTVYRLIKIIEADKNKKM
ncbi:MAG: 2-dehydropantoate 2-reductase [Butyrivibrio sp.]|nr:2-dehydropantoate 2-reductase [Butyrivibrio sp.]